MALAVPGLPGDRWAIPAASVKALLTPVGRFCRYVSEAGESGPLRIDASNRSSSVAGRGAAGKAGSGPAFVPAGDPGAARVANAAPLTPMAGIDAILALQAVGDFTESRRRAVERGKTLLDLLEGMKADLLIGRVGGDRLEAMVGQLSTLRERVEPGLDAVLDDIELRVRVELAKLGRFPQF